MVALPGGDSFLQGMWSRCAALWLMNKREDPITGRGNACQRLGVNIELPMSGHNQPMGSMSAGGTRVYPADGPAWAPA